MSDGNYVSDSSSFNVLSFERQDYFSLFFTHCHGTQFHDTHRTINKEFNNMRRVFFSLHACGLVLLVPMRIKMHGWRLKQYLKYLIVFSKTNNLEKKHAIHLYFMMETWVWYGRTCPFPLYLLKNITKHMQSMMFPDWDIFVYVICTVTYLPD